MGKQIHLEKVRKLLRDSPVVEFKSIERIINEKKRKKARSSYAKLLVSNLLRKGEIKKIGKGAYTTHDETSLAVFSYKPAYLGLQSSLSKHGLWEQETIPVIITLHKARRGIRNFLGGNVMIRNIDKRHFFGFNYIQEGSFYLPYSDIEKTFIDMVVFNQKIDEDLLKNFRKAINKSILGNYLKKYSRRIRDKVLGVLRK